MHTLDIEYQADGARLVGQYVVDDGKPGKQPGVLVCHEGPGLTEHTKKIAARLAGLGYAAFAMDYHGDGKPIANPADMRSRIGAWMADPTASTWMGALRSAPGSSTASTSMPGTF